MTIISIPANDRRERFVASGGQTVFTFDFPVYAATDLRVTRLRSGVETVLVYGTDYTVTGAGEQAGGSITLTTGATAADVILIESAMPVQRAAQFTNGGPLPADAIEGELNRIMIALQQYTAQALLAVRAAPTDTRQLILPPAPSRALKFLSFDALGDIIAAEGGVSGVPISTFMATVNAAVDAAAARTLLGVAAATNVYRNRLVNPAMMHSIEHGTANVDATGGVYTLDQWIAALSTTPGGTLRVAQVVSRTPGGSPNRLRATVQVADTTIAAGDRYAIEQPIEGHRIADANFGGVTARQILVRFGFRSPVAGTFGVALSNAAGTRSWVGTFTVGAGEVGTDIERTFVIPGDTTGAWPADPGTRGLLLRITLAAGTTWQGAAGWSAGNFFTTSAQVNGMATGGHVFELFDTGLWVDTLGLGVVPPFVLPDPVEELAKCQRHTYRLERNVFARGVQVLGFGTSINNDVNFPQRMMGTPTTSGAVLSNSVGASSSAVENLSPDGFSVRVTANGAANGEVSIRLDANALFLSRL
jgi:hypothetical protein